jgi:hypothetical protein
MFTKGAGKLRMLAGVMVGTTALLTVGTLSALADGIGPRTGCALTDSSCSYNSGWQPVINNCQAQVTYTWWRTDDVMDISVEVQNSNAFVGCRAYGTPYLQTTSGADIVGGKYYSYSCATWDPTCSSDQTWTYQVSNVVPSQDVASIDQLWALATHN